MRESRSKEGKDRRFSGNRLTDAAQIAALTAGEILLTLMVTIPTKTSPYSLRSSDFYREMSHLSRWRHEERQKFLAKIGRLRRRGLVRTYRRGKNLVMALTSEGETRARRMAIEAVTSPRPKRWDRQWHLIIFDIPEKARQSREVFRRKLRQLGFAQLQKSVFIHPFDATDLVAGIRQAFGLEREIRYVVVDQLEDEEELIHHFLKTKILSPSHFRGGTE